MRELFSDSIVPKIMILKSVIIIIKKKHLQVVHIPNNFLHINFYVKNWSEDPPIFERYMSDTRVRG